jgi:hypothetical protein
LVGRPGSGGPGGRRVVDLVAGADRDVLYVDEPPGVAIHGDEVVHVVDVDVVLYVVKDPRQDRCEPRLSLGRREHVQRHRRRPEVIEPPVAVLATDHAMGVPVVIVKRLRCTSHPSS